MRDLSTLVIASHNEGKVREIGELLQPLSVRAISAASLNLPEPEETGDSFHANAALKSLAAAKVSSLPSLADDSGLVVDALGGAPGIYSARWAGPSKDFALAMERIRQEIIGVNKNPEGASAYFICVLSLALPSGEEFAFEGRVYGHLTFPPRGENGFGYDPIFIPEGYSESFAELSSETKQRISHRSQAFIKLLNFLKNRKL